MSPYSVRVLELAVVAESARFLIPLVPVMLPRVAMVFATPVGYQKKID
jgi:hypothetical protein